MINPTVERIETVVFRLPMHGALRWGKASALHEAQGVLVRVTLSDGSRGEAEAPPRPTIYGETGHSIAGIIAHELAPRIVGMPVALPEAEAGAAQQSLWLPQIQARIHEVKYNYAAKGALDMAIHAAFAQARGVSLAAHLGATAARLKVSYILGIGEPAEMEAEAEHVVGQGVRVLKVKVGREWDHDLAIIKNLQQALGPEVELYADANECMTADEALHKLAQLASLGVLYCEEPLPVEEMRARSALVAARILPVIADDSAFTWRDLQRELAFDTFDILNIKTARTGYSESARMLASARAAGKGVMVGSQASAGLGTARAALFAALPGIDHPSELSFFLKLKEDIITPPLRIEAGFLHLADVLRTQVDDALLAAAAIAGDSVHQPG